MRSQHIPMSIEEFKLMPLKPGWKHEYWDGQAHISPGHCVVVAAMEIAPRPVISPCKLRPVTANDEPQLVKVYLEAFQDTIEYCDWTPPRIADSAVSTMREFFAGKRGKPLPASHLALDSQAGVQEEHLVGAALFVAKHDGRPLLEMLFVLPAWQRKGLATALVAAGVNVLSAAGMKILESRYILGNEASQAWHRRFGFVENPDLFLAQRYHHYAKHELWRREKMGCLTELERQVLVAEVARWQAQVDELEVIAESQRENILS